MPDDFQIGVPGMSTDSSGKHGTPDVYTASGEEVGGSGAGGFMPSSIMDLITGGLASKVISIAGAILADAINAIYNFFVVLFKGKGDWKVTAFEPLTQRIRYGLEGFRAYRYWIALREIRLESNRYATDGYMESDWFEVAAGIARIHLLSEEDIPESFEGRYVKYFVQFGEGEEWNEILPLHEVTEQSAPHFIEVNPAVPINSPGFKSVERLDENGEPLETTQVRVRIELSRPGGMPFFSPRVLSYRLGIRTATLLHRTR